MRFWTLLTCAMICIQQGSANAQYYNDYPYCYVVPAYQPVYYPVESYSASNCSRSQSTVYSQTCNACCTESTCVTECRPVWETEDCGCKTMEYPNARHQHTRRRVCNQSQ